MKILLINSVYGIGSTGKILKSLKTEYEKHGHDVYVLYGRHSSVKKDKKIIKTSYEIESKICHFFSLFTGNLYGRLLFSTLKLKTLIKKINPDVVHLHCLNGYFVNIYSLINFLKRNKINTVLTNHADFMFTGNCGASIECNKWMNNKCNNCTRVKDFNGRFSLNRTNHFYKKMEKSFLNFRTLKITNVSPWLYSRSKNSSFFKNRFNTVVLNPVDNISKPTKNPYEKLRFHEETKIVLFPTASFNNPEKGGQFLYAISDYFKSKNVHFFVKSYLPVKKELKKNSENLTFIEDDDDMFSYYYYADVTLLLSIRETFSMVAAESLCSGTPVVGFLSGGPETICIPEFSSFSKYGDISSLIPNLSNMLKKSYDKKTISKLAQKKYSTEIIAKEYLRIYEK